MLAIVDDTIEKQCVLIVENGSLLGAGVECLLSDEAWLCVVGVTPPDGATLIEIIKHLQPDLIILDEAYFLTLSIGLLAKLLDHPQLRVITVSANNDRVQMYHKQQLLITHATDLVHFIRARR